MVNSVHIIGVLTAATLATVAAAARSGGRYGQWIQSAAGNPVYRYQYDQLSDRPRAAGKGWSGDPPSSDPTVRGSLEHTFQIGNDRLVLVANNYGAVRVRSDEGSPKFFTAAETGVAAATQFGAGFGYLTRKQQVEATTFYTGGVSDRDFGVGWVATSASSAAATVNHTIATPHGDDPVVLVEVAVHNRGSTERSWEWVEVWGSLMLHLDPSWARTAPGKNFTAAHYHSSWTGIDENATGISGGLAHSRAWLGLTPEEKVHFSSIYKYPVPAGAGIWDEQPATPYLIQLSSTGSAQNSSVTSIGNDAAAFFGSGGAANPDGTVRFSHTVQDPDAALITSTHITLPPNGTVKLHYLWGYANSTDAASAHASRMAQKYLPLLESSDGLATAVEAGWDQYLARFRVPSKGYVADETAWHSYYVQAATTYDSYMQEHIVDQGTMYRYSSGFQGAARDPVQHALPLIELRPSLTKSVLRYTLSEMYANYTNLEPAKPGLLPYALYGRAIIADGSFNPLLTGSAIHTAGTAIRPDDMELYVLLCAAEYILGTKDVGFLNETVTFFGRQGTLTVLEALQRAVHFVVDIIGVGPHGLVREMTSDWDDGIAVRPDFVRDFNKSESVLTASLATHALDRIAAALLMVNDHATANRATRFAADNREAILKHAFNGKWLRRAWFGNQTGWIGDTGKAAVHAKGMFSAQHGWSMIGGVFDSDLTALNATLGSLATHCRAGKFGYAYICDQAGSTAAGSSRHLLQYPNAPGMWPAVDHPIVLGLLAVNRTDLAWTEYERNTLHWQASVSPDYWVGIWTSSDSVNGDGTPSEWTADFPGLCTHRHAWPLVSARHLAGVLYTPTGIHIRPGLPVELGRYEWSTPLASLTWDGQGVWHGTYTPSVIGRWTVSVDTSLVFVKSNIQLRLSIGDSSHKPVEVASEGHTISGVTIHESESIWFRIVVV